MLSGVLDEGGKLINRGTASAGAEMEELKVQVIHTWMDLPFP